jgi:class 3 adenylate cyclase
MAMTTGREDALGARVEQPRGTVTFVFTDIEGSTRLLTELGVTAYRDVLTRHRACLRAAFTRYGGYEFGVIGDGLFYAFSSGEDAVRAVREAVACLASGPIRIRVGVHTGRPELDPPDYVGLDVHKAARIMAAGHGGQVLLSEAARAVVVDGFDLRDLGEYRLKDISSAEHLYQLGPGQFPPLRTPRSAIESSTPARNGCVRAIRQRRPSAAACRPATHRHLCGSSSTPVRSASGRSGHSLGFSS